MKADVAPDTTDTPSAMADAAEQRSFLYSFLAKIFRQEVTVQDLRQIKTPAFQTVLAETGVSLGDELESTDEQDMVERLAVEYTALFLGPGPSISLHESVQAQKGGRLWSTATVEVKRFIEDAGFEYVPDFTDMPDHLSVELDFMAHQCEVEAQARRSGDAVKTGESRSLQKAFLTQHLGTWVDAWSEQVAARAEMPFYPELACMLADFVAEENRKCRNA